MHLFRKLHSCVSFLLITQVQSRPVFERTEPRDESLPKTLIYITTHMSQQHRDYLKHCWPQAIKNSDLLKQSDITVYMTPDEDVSGSFLLLEEVFKGLQLNVYLQPNPGYQEGAIAALTEASRRGWFNGYDWVFRLNPDVIIQNDKWMLDTIKNDADAGLLYVSCQHDLDPNRMKIHTDFFGLKMTALSPGFRFTHGENAEWTFSSDVRNLVLDGKHRHIPDSYPHHKGYCRVDGNRDGPVFHFTKPYRSYGVCPANFY